MGFSLVLGCQNLPTGKSLVTEDQVVVNTKTAREYFVAGHEALDREDEQGVLDNFTRAGELATKDTDKAIALNNIGLFYLLHNDLDKAKEYLEKAAAYDETNKKPIYRARIWNNLGQTYEYSEDFARALDCYEKAYQADPTFVKSDANRKRLEQWLAKKALPTPVTETAKTVESK